MALTYQIFLTTAGAGTGPFDLYSDADGFVTPFETNLDKALFIPGYVSTTIPDAATIIRVQNVAECQCQGYIDLYIPLPGTSPSPTPSITPSVTRTPSVTPSITPSITLTPSPTPSPIPATFNWYNADGTSPFVDSNLFISVDGNNVVSEYTTNSGSFTAFGGSNILVEQTADTGTQGFYRLYIKNVTDNIVIYDNTSNVTLPATENSKDFIAAPNTVYLISGSTNPPVSPTPSVTPSVTPTITATPSHTPSITPTITVSPSRTPSVTPTPSITITPSITRTPSVTPTPSAFPTLFLGLSQISATDACNNGELPGYTWILGSRSDTSLCDTSFVRNTSSSILDTIGIGNYFWLKQGSNSRKFQVQLFSFGEFAGETYGLAVESCVICPSPSPTPSITPSITRTPSVTPTRTPSITPSITPTRTPSVTPSATLAGGTLNVTYTETQLGCGAGSATVNGTNTVTPSNSPYTIYTGDTFNAQVSSDCYGYVTLTVNSNTRGTLFNDVSGTEFAPGLLTSTYTVQTGENISVTSSFVDQEPPPPCFVGGTLITLADGTQVPIETLAEGVELESVLIDTLQDTNIVSELYKWSSPILNETRTTSKIAKYSPETVNRTIKVNDGLLQATYNHTQLAQVDGLWKMIRIEDLKIGDLLYDVNENIIPVTSIEVITEPVTVYKLTLEDTSHTYFANNILTHNIK